MEGKGLININNGIVAGRLLYLDRYNCTIQGIGSFFCHQVLADYCLQDGGDNFTHCLFFARIYDFVRT